MESKVCSLCNIEEPLEDFPKKDTKCKNFNSMRILKRYYDNKDNISYQRKLYYEKIKEKLIQKQNERYIHFKELVKPFLDLQNRWKALEENFSKMTQKTIVVFINEIYSEPPKIITPQPTLMFIIFKTFGH